MNNQVANSTVDFVAKPRWVGPVQVRESLTFGDAVTVLEQTLFDGFDPEEDGVRTRHSSSFGQLLQMPSASEAWCGTKLVTVREEPGPAELPVIQGVYVLFEGRSLTPVAILDGAELTALRTPAVTALAIKHLAQMDSGRVTLFGAGVQARAHVKALMSVFLPKCIDVVGRDPGHAQRLSDEIQDMGVESTVASSEVVAQADLILCCTSSSEPLFDGDLVQNHAMIAAIGSHDPESREIDAGLVRRSAVVVESKGSARREAGDLVIPAARGMFHWDDAATLQDVVLGTAALDANRPRLFKGTGMPWQDLAIASSIYLSTNEASSIRRAGSD